MKYTVLQIPFPNTEVQENIYMRYAFHRLKTIDRVHLDYYKTVYEGYIKTKETNIFKVLEKLFIKLNINHPIDYKGRSLSISDIIIINDHYYYCDSLGWVEIEFN